MPASSLPYRLHAQLTFFIRMAQNKVFSDSANETLELPRRPTFAVRVFEMSPNTLTADLATFWTSKSFNSATAPTFDATGQYFCLRAAVLDQVCCFVQARSF